MHMLTAT